MGIILIATYSEVQKIVLWKVFVAMETIFKKWFSECE